MENCTGCSVNRNTYHEFLNCPMTSSLDVACSNGNREKGSCMVRAENNCHDNKTTPQAPPLGYQETLLHIDVVIEVVEAVSSQDGNDDARNDGYGTCEEHSLPFGPLDVQEALRGV